MTLVLGAIYKDNFAVMSGDSMIAYKHLDPITKERLDDATVTATTTKAQGWEKVIKLTDYVLLGLGGSSTTALDLQKEMQKRVSPDYDLTQCKKAMQEVISEFLADEESENSRFLKVEGTGSGYLMTGFYKDGGTGIVKFTSGIEGGLFEEATHKQDRLGYLGSIVSPVVDYTDTNTLRNLLKLPNGFQHTMKNVIDQMTRVHKSIFTNHSNDVTSDMNTHILYKPTTSPGKATKKAKSKKKKKKAAPHLSVVKTPVYKFVEVETNEDGKVETPWNKSDETKLQEMKYAAVAQKMVSGLGRKIEVLGYAWESLTPDNVEPFWDAVEDYKAEVRAVEQEYKGVTPREAMRFYDKGFKVLMNCHLQLVKMLEYFQATADPSILQKMDPVLNDMKAITENVSINIG